LSSNSSTVPEQRGRRTSEQDAVQRTSVIYCKTCYAAEKRLIKRSFPNTILRSGRSAFSS